MKKENDLIMRNTTVKSLSDCFARKELLLLSEHECSNVIYSIETLLNQDPYGQIPKRSYTLNDMITAQKMLTLFNLLETIKYKEHLVNCRPLLHKYLYSGYVLNDCFLNKANSDFHFNTEIDMDTILSYGDSIYTFEGEKNSLCYPKSIRMYFEKYLKTRNECSTHLGYHLITSTQDNIDENNHENNNKKHSCKPRYYLPVNQIPEFLLSFAFFDGRIFPPTYIPKSSFRIPKLDSKKQKSETTYKFVLQQIEIFLNNRQLNSYEKLSHTYQLDRLFLFCKMNRLNQYYTTYISNTFLNRMIKVFELSYEEITQLKESIINYIWSDTAFLLAGHQSSFIDFMLPFDIYFQHNLFFNELNIRLHGEKGLEGLKNIIEECKRQARHLWSLPLHTDIQDILSISNNLLNIKRTQDKIMECLNANSFYKIYFSSENMYWKNYSTSSEKLYQPLSYDILKELLPQ